MDIQRYKFILIGCLLLAASQLYLVVTPGYAQSPAPAATPTVAATPLPMPAAQATAIPLEQSPPGIAEVTFAQLDQSTFELRSPIDQLTFTLNVPYRWTLTGGNSYVELHYDLQYETQNPTSQNAVNAAITIYLNETLLTTFIPTEGVNQTLRLAIPAEAIKNPDKNPYQLRFVYSSGDCDDNFERSQFVVHEDSFIHFDYELLPLEINLANFPRPLVQNLFTQESVLLVIPDDYSDADLAAATSVAATLGQRAFNTNLDIVKASEATPERLANTSAIIIGQPKQNAFLAKLYQADKLPTKLTAEGALTANSATQPISAEDGVLQEIVSDVSPDHVYLIVTGSSDTALTHAARALSVLAPRYGFDGNLVVISEFQEFNSSATQAVDTFKLVDLGFKDTTLYGLEASSASVRFFVPANWRLTDKPTLTLSYFHSGALADSSGLTINLNGKPIGGLPIDDTITGERQALIDLPLVDIKPGTRNRLSFEANLNVQLPHCTLPKLDSTWLRIDGNSLLKLPHIETDEGQVTASLEDSLTPFVSRQDLSDVWFSLPQNPSPEELKDMIRVATRLGNFSDGSGFAPRVSRGAISDTIELESYQVIALGRPSNNPVIAQANDKLPQPFLPNEDNLRQQVGNVVYRLPDQFSLGLLQAVPAPWNHKKIMLVVTGTTPEGVQWATDALTGDLTYYDLKGDLAFIRADRIEAFDSAKFLRSPLGTAVEALTTAEPAKVALEVAPTAVPASPIPAGEVKLPDNYLPRRPDSWATANLLTAGLILAGLSVAALGSVLSWRKAKVH